MCEKCQAIDVKVAYYRQQLPDLSDRTAITLFNLLVADLEAEKATLHSKDT